MTTAAMTIRADLVIEPKDDGQLPATETEVRQAAADYLTDATKHEAELPWRITAVNSPPPARQPDPGGAPPGVTPAQLTAWLQAHGWTTAGAYRGATIWAHPGAGRLLAPATIEYDDDNDLITAALATRDGIPPPGSPATSPGPAQASPP